MALTDGEITANQAIDNGKGKAKLIHLPGTRLTPEVVLRQCLARVKDIKSVIIICQDNEDFYDCLWSQMKLSELSFAVMTLDEDFRRMMRGKNNNEND